MLISSTKAWSTGFLSRTNIFVCIFTFPLVLLASYFIAVPLLQSDGNLSEALIILSDEKASVRGRYVPSPLGILITIGLLFIPIILTKLGRFVGRNTKFGIFNANNIVDVEPKYSGLEKKGALTIKGKQGTARLIGPYIEVFL